MPSGRMRAAMIQMARAALTMLWLWIARISLVSFLWLPAAEGESGSNLPMIIPKNGWKALEILTQGDHPRGGWEIADEMDGLGAFLIHPEAKSNAILRILVNHEDDHNATITEVNIPKGKLKKVIRDILLGPEGNDASANGRGYDFIASARVAYDRWTPNAGRTWKTIGNISDPSEAGGFCRFCSSQYFPPESLGPNRGFVDPIYITGEECKKGRLFALDVASSSGSRDLYQLSGVTGSMPVEDSQEHRNKDSGFPTGTGGMTIDTWENAALVDTGEDDHVAFVLSADKGSETLKLYVGKKFTDAEGNRDTVHFLARNGLWYGRWYYLGGLEWTTTEKKLRVAKTRGHLVTNHSQAWMEQKFEDIDTNPRNSHQIVLAESKTGVYRLDFDLVFDSDHGFSPMESTFEVTMITHDDHNDTDSPDNVDWTKNNLIFVNKDNDEGGVFYMNPDGRNRVQIGHTRENGESTGILDISELLNYPPSSSMLTTNQGTPSSMTLLLNPELKNFLVAKGHGSTLTLPVETPVPASTSSPTALPTSHKAPPTSFDTTAKPSPPPTLSRIQPLLPDYVGGAECPISKENGLFQVLQAEEAILFSANVKSRSKNYCGAGYVDFINVESLVVSRSSNVVLPWTSPIERFGKNLFHIQKEEIIQQAIDAANSLRDKLKELAPVEPIGMSFAFEIFSPGMYRISIRYANGGSKKRTGIFLVDETDVGDDFEFASSFGWDIWAYESKLVPFQTNGRHTLDLFWTKINKRPNIDLLSLELIETF